MLARVSREIKCYLARLLQISLPKTSEPLHSSWTRTVSSLEGSLMNAGLPTIKEIQISDYKVRIRAKLVQIYTVSPPIGGRNTLMSGRVINSGYMPPVSSKSARRRSDSVLQENFELMTYHGAEDPPEANIPNRSATPGKYQTGSMAALLTGNSTPGSKSEMLPSSLSRGRLFTTNFPSTGRLVLGRG